MDRHNVEKNAMRRINSSNDAPGKYCTPNKHWKIEFDNFLILLSIEYVNKSLEIWQDFEKPKPLTITSILWILGWILISQPIMLRIITYNKDMGIKK